MVVNIYQPYIWKYYMSYNWIYHILQLAIGYTILQLYLSQLDILYLMIEHLYIQIEPTQSTMIALHAMRTHQRLLFLRCAGWSWRRRLGLSVSLLRGQASLAGDDWALIVHKSSWEHQNHFRWTEHTMGWPKITSQFEIMNIFLFWCVCELIILENQ